MSGIGSMVGGERPAPTQRSAEPAIDDGEQPNVSPEEQAEYEQFVGNAMSIIYPDDGQVSPNVVQALQGSDDPMMNLATTAVSLVSSLRDSAKQAGHRVPDEILYHGAVAIIEELGEVAEAAGIHDYSEDDLEQALYLSLDLYRTAGEQSGDVDAEQLKAGFAQIQQADQQGRIEEVLPGIQSRMQGGR
jgi:hypothetical protein